MNGSALIGTTLEYLNNLCAIRPHRQVGSAGNRTATEYFARVVGQSGFKVEESQFDCLDWESGAASLNAGKEAFEIVISGYSLGCNVNAPLAVVSSLPELETIDARGHVLLVRGELTAEQLMPKNFTFFNPEHHQRFVALLEEKDPLAIVAATGHNPELAGALYPFPLIEDGDFNIPAAHMKDVDGERLAAHAGQMVELKMEAHRIPARCSQVTARKGNDPTRRVVVCGHIDAKASTPGALDNAAGAAVLLLLAELLKEYTGRLTVELVPFNGEDHYSAAGQKLYVHNNQRSFGEILLAVNLDGLGWRGSPTSYSFYAMKDEMMAEIRDVFGNHAELVEGHTWPQSDHMIFAMNGCPAVAITTERFAELERDIAHTERDVPSLVDPAKLVATAQALVGVIHRLNE
jgi:aminopeptidase YwaD